MSSCVKARAALSDFDGVVRVHPYGLNGRVMVYVSKRDALDKETIEGALKMQGLRLRKIRAR